MNTDNQIMNKDKISKTTLWVMLLVLAFSVTPRISVASLEYGRSVDLRYEDIVILAILYFLMIAALTGRKIILNSPITKILTIYLGLITLSTVIGVSMEWITAARASFYYLKELEYFIIFFIIINFVETERESYCVVWTLIALGLANNAYSIFQIATQGFRGYYGIALIGEISPFGIGGYLSLLLLLSLSLYTSGYVKGRLARILVLLNVFGCLLSLIFTGSRAFVFGTALAGLIFLLLRGEKKILIIAFSIMIVILTLFISQVVYPNLPGKAPIEDRIANIVHIEESLSGRLKTAYEPVLKMLSENPVLGYGKSITGTAKVPTEAHNSFLRVLLETGTLGLIAFILLILAILRMSIRLYKRGGTPYEKMIGTACILCTVSILVASLVQDAFTPVKVNEVYWVIVGLTALSYRHLEDIDQ